MTLSLLSVSLGQGKLEKKYWKQPDTDRGRRPSILTQNYQPPTEKWSHLSTISGAEIRSLMSEETRLMMASVQRKLQNHVLHEQEGLHVALVQVWSVELVPVGK